MPPSEKMQVGQIDGELVKRVDVARGYEPRTKLVERLLVDWLESRSTAPRQVAPEPPAVPLGVEMAQRRVSGHVRPPIPKKGS